MLDCMINVSQCFFKGENPVIEAFVAFIKRKFHENFVLTVTINDVVTFQHSVSW